LLDLVQTLSALGGANVPSDWDGDSMVPWIDNPSYSWKDMAVSEFYGHAITSGYVMLRQGQWKYVYHTKPTSSFASERELYNMVADPNELNNLASDPAQASRITQMHATLIAELGEDPEQTELRSEESLRIGYNRVTMDSDGDTINDLTEYSLNMDPSASSSHQLPITSLTSVAGAEYLTLTYTRFTNAKVNFVVEVSSDMKTWGTQTTQVSSVNNANSTTTITVRDTVAFSSLNQRYIRLRMTEQ
jgi:hypothetical protein